MEKIKSDQLTPEELETQRHNLVFFKGASNALDEVLSLIDNIDDIYFEPLYTEIFLIQKQYTDAEMAILDSQEYEDAMLSIEESQNND